MGQIIVVNIILYLGPYNCLEPIKNKFPIPVVHCQSYDDITENIGQSIAIIDASLQFKFSKSILTNANSLKVFFSVSTGIDHIDVEYLNERKIDFHRLSGQPFLRDVTAAAEHSWLLLMACCRNLRKAIDHVIIDGKWERSEHPGWMLRGRSIGLIGCGRIGQWMARYANVFGMTVRGCDPYLCENFSGEIIKSLLNDVLSMSDIVSVHVPLNKETRGMIGKNEFSLMKKGSIFVNTSRGDIIDEDALLIFLKNGHLKAAGLDVIQEKHSSPLVEYAKYNSNLIITPHIAGFSYDALDFLLSHVVSKIKEYL